MPKPSHDHVLQPGDRFLRIAEVCRRTGLGKSRIYRMIEEGGFPKPVPLGPNSVAWVESHITGWQLERIAARDQMQAFRRGRRLRKMQAAE